MNENKENTKKRFKIRLLDILLIILAIGVAAWFFIKPKFEPEKRNTDNKKIIMFVGNKEIEIPFKDQKLNLKEDFFGADLKRYNINRDITLEIKDKNARVTTSNCPDKVCVNSGWASECGDVIICMPNVFGVLISCDNKNENK